MSVEALAVVLHHSKATATDKLVLLGIANHDGDGGAWPAMSTLAKYANVHTRNVQRAITRLVELGELRVHLQDGGKRNTPDHERPNRYDVLVACPPTCDGTAQHRVKRLPQAPADLWIEGVAPTPGGGAHATGGVAPTPGEGVAPTPPEPSLEPSTPVEVLDNLTVSRAHEHDDLAGDPAERTPTCAECSAPNMASCYRRQLRLAEADRHLYRAVIR